MKRNVFTVALILFLAMLLSACNNGNGSEESVCTCSCCQTETPQSPDPDSSIVTQTPSDNTDEPDSETTRTPDTETSATSDIETSATPDTETTESPETTKSPETETNAPETDPIPQGDDILIEYKVDLPDATFSGLPVLSNQKFIVTDPNNTRGISTSPYAFSFGAAKNGKPHSITVDNQARFDSSDTNTLAWDNKTEEKVIYLTFDCGYKYKDLDTRILDTLMEKNVKATFFCTLSYVKAAPSEITRMINEGHIIGNHTANHPSDCAKLTRERLAVEILALHNYVRAYYGYNMEYFRFPGGNYSYDNLDLSYSVGYKTVFWSIAHADWDPENQPGVEKSLQTITERLHPGAVILLHSTSPDNVEILGRFIDYCRAEGYEFRSLDQYAYWK